MFLTSETLRARGCPETFLKKFEVVFGAGAECVEVIQSLKGDTGFLYWLHDWFDFDKKEQIAWTLTLGLDGSSCFHDCVSIKNSNFVANSRNIMDSNHVNESCDIANSRNIHRSNEVHNSTDVYTSMFVYDSKKVLDSQNVTNSNVVFGSTNVIDSKSVHGCKNIENSIGVYECKNVENLYLSSYCVNSNNCLFCYDIHDASYMIFNKPVSKRKFEVAMKQFEKMVALPLYMLHEKPSKMAALRNQSHLYANRVIYSFYKDLDEKFWKWASTLPNYDVDLMYNITLSDKVIGFLDKF